MGEENISQEFTLKNQFIKEIDQNDLISKKHKKVSTILNYIDTVLL